MPDIAQIQFGGSTGNKTARAPQPLSFLSEFYLTWHWISRFLLAPRTIDEIMAEAIPREKPCASPANPLAAPLSIP